MSAGSDPIVRFEQIQKTYDGENYVVKDLNLDIERGEFLTLLGPSGCGKSTCLMMLAGFESPTRGKIILDGTELNNIPPYKRDIGVVFQNYALFPHMTIAENVAFPLMIRKTPASEVADRVKRALDMVQLKHLGDRKPAQLSGGQQQRVACARALVFDPKLVLLDEPLGALDKKLRESMQIELKHIHESLGVTMVFVTHDQDEALTMSDRIAVFSDGGIQQLSNPQTLYDEPANAFVANFIGETNMLAGRVMTVDGDHCQVALDRGGSIVARRQGELSINQPIQVSVRPELAHCVDPASGTSFTNQLSSKVVETIYHGDHLSLSLDITGTAEERTGFNVKIPTGSDYSRLDQGQAVTVGFHPDDCRALSMQ